MAVKQDKQPEGGDPESEVWSAIAAFEQILEAIPNDRTSLETLAHAYEQIGDMARAKDYTIRLVEVVLSELDQQEARNLLPKFEQFAAGDPVATELLQRLRVFVTSAASATAVKAVAAATAAAARQEEKEKEKKEHGPVTLSSAAAHARSSFNIANELPLAWNLLKANELTQEEYSNVVQDLTELSATDASVTVSVLHVLHDRSFKNISRVLTMLAKECSTPIISLTSFDLQPDAYSLLPLDFMVKRGVIIFDFFGDAALAVVLNPYDKELMKDVETVAGRKCFFYLTPPAEFDVAINKINASSDPKVQGMK